MRYSQVIKARNDAKTRLRDLYSMAQHFGMSSETIDSRYATILGQMPKGTPWHAKAYLEGYRQALNDKLYETTLIYGGWINGVFYSTHSSRPDYYERHGISPCEYATSGKVTMRGHYWPNLKPYFIGSQ